MDAEIEALLRRGEIEQAALVASQKGLTRRAAELLALAQRYEEAVRLAWQAGEWRLALDIALGSGDEGHVELICAELDRRPDLADAAAAHARIARRTDVAARLLEPSAPAEAGAGWYSIAEYLRAARCFDRAGDVAQAMRAYEQHLAQAPDDVEVAERLADLRATRGDNEGAVRALQAAVRAGAGAPVLRKLVDGLARIGLEGAARAVARRIRARDPAASVDVRDYADALPVAAAAEKRYAGRYRVVREVGSGATGRVLEAVDELTGETVALKVLSVGDDRSAAFGRFMREAELARSLDDPRLVRMRAFDPEGPTIVYDWMPGGTLAERVGSLRVAEVHGIALRLLAALETLHRNGVVHRDLKPSNVLFDPAGQARLGDLGAAHLSDLGATVTGGLVGSLPYMSPEQITGEQVSAATDLYAFGCVLFQMLTGEPPYPGPDYVTQHLSSPVPDVSDARPALGLAYDAVVAALLAKDPLARPQDVASARRLLADLPWAEPDDEDKGARTSRRSSIPAAASEEGARLVPSITEGRWTDARLGREVEIVRLPAARREALERWASDPRTSLQPVYELYDDGDEVVAWTEPVAGEELAADELPPPDLADVEAALTAVGLALPPRLVPVVRNAHAGAVVPLRALLR